MPPAGVGGCYLLLIYCDHRILVFVLLQYCRIELFVRIFVQDFGRNDFDSYVAIGMNLEN